MMILDRDGSLMQEASSTSTVQPGQQTDCPETVAERHERQRGLLDRLVNSVFGSMEILGPEPSGLMEPGL